MLSAVVGMELPKEAIDTGNARDETRMASPASTAQEAASGSEGGTSRIEHLEQLRSRCATELEFEIESSKEHWTELDSETSLSGEELVAANREVFERLMEQFRCPKTGECFFHDWGESLTLGAKIAEGGQAEIFSAELRGEDGSIHDEIVVKAFKSGYCLKDLEQQWPQGMFVTKSMETVKSGGKQDRNADKISTHFIHENCCFIHGGTLLANGRFGFVLERYWGDLRRLIDLKRRASPKFYVGDSEALVHNMLYIAKGMLKLHEHGILHRDLKASNVLVQLRDPKDFGASRMYYTFPGYGYRGYDLDVADFESSVGVMGTGFWRAPEVLLALKNRSLGPETWTKKCDVYGYAMTCYELMTGRIPFEDHGGMNADNVINGARPLWPSKLRLCSNLCDLVERCWHSDSLLRPVFGEIVNRLRPMFFHERVGGAPLHYTYTEHMSKSYF